MYVLTIRTSISIQLRLSNIQKINKCDTHWRILIWSDLESSKKKKKKKSFVIRIKCKIYDTICRIVVSFEIKELTIAAIVSEGIFPSKKTSMIFNLTVGSTIHRPDCRLYRVLFLYELPFVLAYLLPGAIVIVVNGFARANHHSSVSR